MIPQTAMFMILCLFALSIDSSIGIIDRTESHFADMVKVVGGKAEVIGTLVKTTDDIAIAIHKFIVLGRR